MDESATMRRSAVSAVLATIVALAGCEGTRTAANASGEPSEPGCPAQLQGQVRVSASAVPYSVAADLAVDNGPANGVLGRRILLSVSPAPAARGISIVSSTLRIVTLGGTFKGWAALSDDVVFPTASRGNSYAGERANPGKARAIDVIPGRLRIAPFLQAPTLRAQTIALDVLVVPGGAPIDEMAISAIPLWKADLSPVSPDQLRLSLTPLRHFTVYDVVNATITLEFVAARSRSATQQWTCSVETPITLVDSDAVRPPLWDLRKPVQTARSEFWLALAGQRTGPFRAIFTSPADAAAFATWLRQTHAERVGEYQLGMFRPEYSLAARRTVPASHSVLDSFRPAGADELNALVVGRLGEP